VAENHCIPGHVVLAARSCPVVRPKGQVAVRVVLHSKHYGVLQPGMEGRVLGREVSACYAPLLSFISLFERVRN
jgi:hypothetical protein